MLFSYNYAYDRMRTPPKQHSTHQNQFILYYIVFKHWILVIVRIQCTGKGSWSSFLFDHFILHTFNLLAIRSCPIFNIAQATKNILLKKPHLTSREVEWCTIHLNSTRVPKRGKLIIWQNKHLRV